MAYPFEKLPWQPERPASLFADFQVYAIVEQEYGTTERTVWDEARHEFVKTGRVMAVPLPAPYGWIPQTLSLGDNDPLDVLILTQRSLAQGDYLIVRPIGVLLRQDKDHKVLAVDIQAEYYGRVHDYSQLPDEVIQQIEDWFRPYFALDGWLDAPGAQRMIEQDHQNWQATELKEKES